ncbi:MAG: hypothetical protein ACE5J3_07950, partial [Methanosarcinales archaeon]
AGKAVESEKNGSLDKTSTWKNLPEDISWRDLLEYRIGKSEGWIRDRQYGVMHSKNNDITLILKNSLKKIL